MAHRKTFPRDFKIAPNHFARRAHSPLHLRGLIDGLLQLSVLAA